MVIRDEQKGLALPLQFQSRFHHAEIIAQVQFARGLDARKYTHINSPAAGCGRRFLCKLG